MNLTLATLCYSNVDITKMWKEFYWSHVSKQIRVDWAVKYLTSTPPKEGEYSIFFQ